MRTISTNDGTGIAVTDWGEGRPVLFAHAWGLNSDMWTYQMPDLMAAGLRGITFDRRGHGRSSRPVNGYDHDTFAGDLAAIIDELDLRDLTLVGHSAGCGDIVRYLGRFGSERVARIVLVAPVLPLLLRGPENPGGVDPDVAVASADLLRRDVPGWCAANASGFFGDRDVSPGLSDWVSRQIIDVPVQVLLATVSLLGANDWRAELASIELPSLVVQGDLDVSAPIACTGRRCAELLPECELLVYEGAGHGLYASDAPRLNADLLRFVGGAGTPDG